MVYPSPQYIVTLGKSTPISDHVQVDFELRGCPINKNQLLELVAALLSGRKPNLPTYSVCMECKQKGNTCIMVAHGTACLGPVTQAGCNAICPSYDRGCYGCFGPKETPNTSSLSDRWLELGKTNSEILLAFRTFNSNADAFRKESEAHER
jgi:coenzyme F420-reducing hydrogenase gamma subunit